MNTDGIKKLFQAMKSGGHNKTNPLLGARRRIKPEYRKDGAVMATYHTDIKQYIDKFNNEYKEEELI